MYTNGETVMRVVTTRMELIDVHLVDRAAQQAGLTRSELIRRAAVAVAKQITQKEETNDGAR